MASVNWHLWGALAMAAVGGMILLAMIIGAAAGLGVLMYRLCSGDARIVRAKRHRRSQHRLAPYPQNGEISSPASLLSGGALDDTADLPPYQPEGKDHHG